MQDREKVKYSVEIGVSGGGEPAVQESKADTQRDLRIPVVGSYFVLESVVCFPTKGQAEFPKSQKKFHSLAAAAYKKKWLSSRMKTGGCKKWGDGKKKLSIPVKQLFFPVPLPLPLHSTFQFIFQIIFANQSRREPMLEESKFTEPDQCKKEEQQNGWQQADGTQAATNTGRWKMERNFWKEEWNQWEGNVAGDIMNLYWFLGDEIW